MGSKQIIKSLLSLLVVIHKKEKQSRNKVIFQFNKGFLINLINR